MLPKDFKDSIEFEKIRIFEVNGELCKIRFTKYSKS